MVGGRSARQRSAQAALKVHVEFHPAADKEVDAAVEWYEVQLSGLGAEFFAELGRALGMLTESPRSWPLWPGARTESLGIRRFLMRRFPFALPYLVVEERIIVLAVAHVRRRPGYWLRRIPVL
ncbi:type II toxin-antitoxin system RelE/ParE family toxin [Hyalangium versicolor]|uniref:type II toxin-antitoxin system RelE/ParE family toxin n=1 Tax=Hyalangium versicolor TaxID=2861190 RepID=UPI001CCF4D3E